jgi:hypothetical protein
VHEIHFEDSAISRRMINRPANRSTQPPYIGRLMLRASWPVEIRLFGTEQESVKRDLYTFERVNCSHLKVRGV